MEITHPSHIHPLILVEKKNEDGVFCYGCERIISGSAYGCTKCSLFLHKSCSEIPQEIQHFMHHCLLTLRNTTAECEGCCRNHSGFMFVCDRCDFHLGMDCALQSTIQSEPCSQIIQHFSHMHPLTLLDLQDEKYGCNLCGRGSREVTYECKPCKPSHFRFHKSCLDKLTHTLQSFFHPCPLVFHQTSMPYRCEACRERRTGMSFSCRKCGFDMEPMCGLASTKMSETGTDGKIQHFGHGHPLELIPEGAKNCCMACGKTCFGPTYKCAGNSYYSYTCNFFIHKSCANFPPEIQHPFHPKHTLSLLAKVPESVPSSSGCSACARPSSGFVYFCAKCRFYMDADCASLTPSIRYNQHKHLLTLFDESENCFECNLCEKICRGSFLRCVECNFNLHVHCHPSLPQTINHECHVDPLTFTKLLVQDDFYESEEFYCDVCEEKRNPEAPVYYCAECDYVAHIRCVLSEVFAKEDKLDASKIREDSRMTELDNEIRKLYREMEDLEEEAKRVKTRMDVINTDMNSFAPKSTPANPQVTHYVV